MTDSTSKQLTPQEAWIEPQVISLDSKASAIYFKVGPDGSTYANSTKS